MKTVNQRTRLFDETDTLSIVESILQTQELPNAAGSEVDEADSLSMRAKISEIMGKNSHLSRQATRLQREVKGLKQQREKDNAVMAAKLKFAEKEKKELLRRCSLLHLSFTASKPLQCRVRHPFGRSCKPGPRLRGAKPNHANHVRRP